jgi:hypothetical protein
VANPITGNLPAPHDCISISVTPRFNSWYVRYTGTPQQLVAAGVVDDDMVRKINSQKGGARIGKDGMLFKLKSGRIPAHIQWSRDEAVGFERKGSAELIMQLPGMIELFPDGPPDDGHHDDELTPEQLVAQFPTITMGMAWVANAMAERIGASSVRNASLRVRCVGRRQRPAQWLSIGKVIAPRFAGGAA